MRRADASGAQEVPAVPAMPTSVAIDRFSTICAWTAVPTLVCASGEPLGITTCGVTETRPAGVKLAATPAIAVVARPLRVPATGICSNNRVNGTLPLVVTVAPRTGDASAGPA